MKIILYRDSKTKSVDGLAVGLSGYMRVESLEIFPVKHADYSYVIAINLNLQLHVRRSQVVDLFQKNALNVH